MKVRFLLFIFLLVPLTLLPGCGGTLSIAFDTTPTPDPAQSATVTALETRVATMEAARRPLDLNSSAGDIRAALLESYTTWQTLWVDADYTAYTSDGSAQVERVQAWIDRPAARFRVLSGPTGGAPKAVQLSDGATQERISLPDFQIQTQPLSEASRDPGWTAPPESGDTVVSGDTVIPHPLELEIDHPIGDLLLPNGLAQRSVNFTPTTMEKVAGITALVVESSDNQGLIDRLWIDTRTGLVLRYQGFDKSRASQPVSEITVNAIEYDASLPEQLFALQLREPPQFALDAAGVPQATGIPPSTAFKPGAGELYFVVDRSPEPLGLFRLPGNCITGGDLCPEPLPVEGYPNKENTIEPLIWSPDGSMAVLVHQGMLYRFTPDDGLWKPLAQFPYIIDPQWSPDGKMLAFIVQLDDALQDIYTVGADGSNIQNLTGGQFGGVETHLWIDGWLADGRLLYQVITVVSSDLYVQRTGEKTASKLEGIQLEHGVLTIMPGGQSVVYSTQGKNAATLQVAELPGGQPRKLGTFKDSSVQQILVSPDGDWVAFLLSTGGLAASTNTVYAIRPDGSDLRQLYQVESIQRLVFAGPGYLLAEGLPNGRVAIIPLDGAAASTLEAPGLRLDQRMLGISWR